MSPHQDSTSLLCLFHHEGHALAALRDLEKAGVSQASVTRIEGRASAALDALDLPGDDRDHLEKGLRDGAILLLVTPSPEHVAAVERIFADHSARKFDEYERELPAASALASSAPGQAVTPVVQEELQVGKRTVDQGGVRVFRRLVTIPVEESVALREEHVVVERTPVDRPATADDLETAGGSLELTETAEELLVSKSAQVVEEVVVGKQTTEHTERIQDTVRRTEVEIEELPAASGPNPSSLRR